MVLITHYPGPKRRFYQFVEGLTAHSHQVVTVRAHLEDSQTKGYQMDG